MYYTVVAVLLLFPWSFLALAFLGEQMARLQREEAPSPPRRTRP